MKCTVLELKWKRRTGKLFATHMYLMWLAIWDMENDKTTNTMCIYSSKDEALSWVYHMMALCDRMKVNYSFDWKIFCLNVWNMHIFYVFTKIFAATMDIVVENTDTKDWTITIKKFY